MSAHGYGPRSVGQLVAELRLYELSARMKAVSPWDHGLVSILAQAAIALHGQAELLSALEFGDKRHEWQLVDGRWLLREITPQTTVPDAEAVA